MDSNHRRHKPADLQSAPVGRLGIPPANEPAILAATPSSSAANAPASKQNNRIFIPSPFGRFSISTTALNTAGRMIKSNPPPAAFVVASPTNIHDAEQEEPLPDRGLAGILGLQKLVKGGYWLLLLLLLLFSSLLPSPSRSRLPRPQNRPAKPRLRKHNPVRVAQVVQVVQVVPRWAG